MKTNFNFETKNFKLELLQLDITETSKIIFLKVQ